jgi:opacity protein-like surface antigen
MKITMLRVTMNKPKSNFIVFIFLILSALTVDAQEDFESWHCIDIDYKLMSKTNVWLSNEIRLDDNSTGFKKYLVDIGVDRKLIKKVTLSLAYRYSRFDDIVAYKNEHMFYGSVQYSYNIQRYTLSVQTKYQYSNILINSNTLEKTESFWRNKLSVNYNLSQLPLTPYISYEYFSEITPEGLLSDKYRLFGGLKYKLNKSNSLALYYGIQNSLQKPGRSYILGLKYSLSLERKDKKDNDSDEDTYRQDGD